MEISRLGVELVLQLPVYTTATTIPDPSRICDLYHSSRKRQILNLMVPSWIRFCGASMGTPAFFFFLNGYTRGIWKFLGPGIESEPQL